MMKFMWRHDFHCGNCLSVGIEWTRITTRDIVDYYGGQMMSRSRVLIYLLVAIATVPVIGCSSSKNKPANFSEVADDDPEMVAAIAKARKSLPDFWNKFAKHSEGESGFSLKVKIKDEHGTEHFWVIDLNRQNGKITGVINNDPEIVHSVKLGQQITVPEN